MDQKNDSAKHLRILLTFRNIFPLVLFSMILVLAMRQSTALDPDLWWHLKTGEQIVNNKGIPHIDDFSFTKKGAEWVTHEWLSEVLIFGIFRAGGLVGLVVIFSLLIVTTLLITYLRCQGRPYVAGLATLLAAAASSPLFGIRPQMITFLLASVFVLVLESFIRGEIRYRLWLLVPTMFAWVNLHAGFALGLALIGFYLVGAMLDRSWTRLKPLIIVLVFSIVVVPINPNGFRMFLYPLETLTSQSMAAIIEEWASPDFHQTMYLPFACLLFGTFAALAISPKRPRLSELFLLLVTSLMALRSVRHIPIFALIAAPVFANYSWQIMTDRKLDKWFTAQQIPPNVIKLLINAGLLLLPLVLLISRVWQFATHERAYEAIRNPVEAVDFLLAHQLPGPIYNRYGWGGYLIYRLYPGYRVYIDGRADVYGDQFFAEAMSVYDGSAHWRQTLDRYGVKTVLIAPDVALASLLRNNSQWKIVYEDEQSIIFNRQAESVPSLNTSN